MKYNDGATADITHMTWPGTDHHPPFTPRRSSYTPSRGWYDASKFYAAGALPTRFLPRFPLVVNCLLSYISSGSSLL